MKILSDFDGVITDLAEEAGRVREIFLELLPPDASALVAEAEGAMRAKPMEHGWRVKERITAFWNEDGFVETNALAAALDAMQGGVKTNRRLAQDAYNKAVGETAAGHMKPVDSSVKRVFETLRDRGVEIVVVSNSGTERIVQLLKNEGLDPQAHEKGSKAPLRVRGHAGKYLLGDEPVHLNVGAHVVDIDRPGYREIMLEEKPDLVVGDVFSLDLALPLALSRAGEIPPLKIALRRRPYSPDWVLRFMREKSTPGAVLERFEDLLSMV